MAGRHLHLRWWPVPDGACTVWLMLRLGRISAADPMMIGVSVNLPQLDGHFYQRTGLPPLL